MQSYSEANSNCFSMFISMPDHNNNNNNPYEEGDMYSCAYSSSPSHSFYYYSSSSSSPSSSVDCTLSLGTPSTRGYPDSSEKRAGREKRSSNFVSNNFRWGILQSKHSSTPAAHKSGGAISNSGGDPLLARRCANCDTTSTPLWRNGPRGPKSLCNACGIRFKKEERKATAAAAAASGGGGGGGDATGIMESQHYSTWDNHRSWDFVPFLASQRH